jgi:hypothetical protein
MLLARVAMSLIYTGDVQTDTDSHPFYKYDVISSLCEVTELVRQFHAFTAGIVLLLNIWGGKKSGLSTDPSKEMADVHKCMGLLKSLESRYVFRQRMPCHTRR